MKNKKITIEDLARMMQKGFLEVDEKMHKGFLNVEQKISDLGSSMDVKLVNLEMRMIKRMEVMEERWNEKFDKLTATVDRLLKRYDDLDDEFTIMKHDLNKMKKIIREKLGVDLT